MNTPEENTDTPGTKLSRIYKTDPFGFPLYQADEYLYEKDKESGKPETESHRDEDTSASSPESENKDDGN